MSDFSKRKLLDIKRRYIREGYKLAKKHLKESSNKNEIKEIVSELKHYTENFLKILNQLEKRDHNDRTIENIYINTSNMSDFMKRVIDEYNLENRYNDISKRKSTDYANAINNPKYRKHLK